MFIHKYTICALEGIYLTNNNNKTKTKTKTKQKRERQKEKRKGTDQDSNTAPCQKLYEHMVNVLQTIFKLLNSYLLREIFPSDDVDFSCVMIREVGEDPLSPALRDIEREREREGRRGREREGERERPELH